MNAARVKAVELALVAVQFGLPVKDAQNFLDVAELFRGYIDPPESTVSAADGDDYDRVQGSGWANPGPGSAPIPDRY